MVCLKIVMVCLFTALSLKSLVIFIVQLFKFKVLEKARKKKDIRQTNDIYISRFKFNYWYQYYSKIINNPISKSYNFHRRLLVDCTYTIQTKYLELTITTPTNYSTAIFILMKIKWSVCIWTIIIQPLIRMVLHNIP